MEKHTFDIIVTTFGRLDYTKRTIASLIDSGAVADCERFIIVDNATDEQANPGMTQFLIEMKNQYGAFLLLRPHNRGWGTAVNDALNMSRAPYVLVSNNDVIYSYRFHDKLFEILDQKPNIGILGVWRHTAHGFVNGSQNDPVFREMDNVPAVGWMMPKGAMIDVGLLPEHGPCFTKGGNGEDTAYVNRMKEKGYLVGVPSVDVAEHIDGY